MSGINWKGISTVTAAIFIHIILGNVYTWSNINGYLSSYLHINDKSITLVDGYFFVPVTILADTYVIWLSGYFEKFFGTRLLSGFGVVTAVACNLLIYFFEQYWIIMGSFVLYGLGIGIAYYPILKTCWKYFPEKKGLITGLVLCCFGLSPFAFTTLADLIINKEGTPADDEGIFPDEVAIKMKDYSLIMAIVQGSFGLIALLIMFPMDSVESTDKDDKKKDAEGEENLIKSEETAEVEKPKEDTNDSINEKPLKQAALSFKFHMFNLMSVGTLFFGYFSTNTCRSFGSLNKINETYLQTMSKVCSFLNGLFRIAWGFVFDCLGFKIPYLIVVINQLVVSSTFYFSAKNKYLYFAANLMENVTFSGHGTIAPPLVTQIFGMKNAIILLGITGYYIGSCGFVGALIAKFIIKKSEDYLIVYLIGAAFAVMSLIITIFMNGDKFPYIPQHTRVTVSAVEPENLIKEDAPKPEDTQEQV